MGMTFEEKGAYLELLIMQWHCDRIPKAHATRLVGDDLWSRICHKFLSDEKGFYNPRIEIEKQKRSLHCEKQRENAFRRWDKKNITPQCDGIAMAMPLENENGNEDKNTNVVRKEEECEKKKTSPLESFELFWASYPKRLNKGQAERAWKALNPGEQLVAEILQGIERAKTSDKWLKDAGQFIPYPCTWLRARGWEDEIEKTAGQDPSLEKYKRGMI